MAQRSQRAVLPQGAVPHVRPCPRGAELLAGGARARAGRLRGVQAATSTALQSAGAAPPPREAARGSLVGEQSSPPAPLAGGRGAMIPSAGSCWTIARLLRAGRRAGSAWGLCRRRPLRCAPQAATRGRGAGPAASWDASCPLLWGSCSARAGGRGPSNAHAWARGRAACAAAWSALSGEGRMRAPWAHRLRWGAFAALYSRALRQ